MSIKIAKQIYEKFYMKKAESKCSIINEKYKTILSETFWKDIEKILYSHFEEYGIKVILQDFHNTFDYFFEKDVSYYYNKYLMQQAGFIERNIDFFNKYGTILDMLFNYICEVLSNLSQYQNIINNKFKIRQFIIDHIVMTDGDSHNGGKKVLIIEVSGIKLVYKPRKMSGDSFFYEMIDLFNEETGEKLFIPQILTFESFSLEEFIDCEIKCEDTEDINNFYYELGVQCCMLYALAITDIHYENIIACGKHPVIIDLETVFQEPVHVKEENINGRLIEESVLYTLLFDFLPACSGEVKSSMGGINSYENKTYLREKIIDDEKDSVRIDKINETMIVYNLPKLNNKPQKFYFFISQFLSGFEAAYRFLLGEKNKIVMLVEKTETFNVRVVVRPTYVYSKFLEALKEPIGYQDQREEKIFQILKNSDKLSAYDDRIFDEECAALLRRDIPYFYMNIDEKYLSVLNKNEEEKYQYTPREYVKQRIEALSEFDLNYQMDIIQMVCACNYENDEENTNMCNALVMKKKKVIPSEKTILFYLKKLEKMSRNKVYWQALSIRYDNNGAAAVSPLDCGIYDGLCGIGLLFLAVQAAYLSDKQEIINKIEKSMKNIYDNNSEYNDNYSIFHGKFSYLKYWWIKYKMGMAQRIEFENELIKICYELLNKVKDNEYIAKDYIGGLAGAVSFLTDVYKEYSITLLEQTIVTCVEYIIRPMKEEKKEYISCDFMKDRYLAGFAHGLTGIVYSVAKCVREFKILKNKCNIQLLSELLKKEDELFDRKRMGWIDNRDDGKQLSHTTWCSGAAGILLGRVEIKKFDLGIEVNYIEETKKILTEHCFTKSIGNSLCHGSIGNLMIIKYLSKRDLEMQKTGKNLLFNLRKDYWERGIQSGYKFNNPGLSFFLGIPGELYGILYYYHDNIPFILI